MPTLTPKVIKIFKTCNLYLLFLAEGMCLAVPGPTLLDLQDLVSTDLKHITYIYTARSLGVVIGSLGGGVVFDLIKRKQYVLALFTLILSFTTLAIPWSRSILTLTTWMVTSGFCLGVLDTGGNVCCLHLWGKDSGPFFQGLHFSVGVGGLIAILIAAQFVGGHLLPDKYVVLNSTSRELDMANFTSGVTLGFPNVTDVYSTIVGANPELLNESSIIYDATTGILNATGMHSIIGVANPQLLNVKNSIIGGATTGLLNATDVDSIIGGANLGIPPVTYVFSIIGGYDLLVALIFFIVALLSPFDEQGQKDANIQEKKRSLGNMMVVVPLNFVLMFVAMGAEIGFAQMLATYAVKGRLQLSPRSASFLTSAYWAAFTVTRFLSVILATKFSCLVLIVSDIVIMSISAVVLVFLAVTNEWALWLAAVLFGTGIASFYPSAINWANEYISVTNKIAATFTVGACFGEMVIPYTVGRLIEDVPEILSYVVAASCVISVLITFILYWVYNTLEGKPSKGNVNHAYAQEQGT